MSEIPPPTVPPATPPPPGGGSYTPPPPPPPGGSYSGGPTGPASSDRTLWIILSYFGILALVAYLVKKDDPDQDIRWHTKNGLGLCIGEIVISVALVILSIVLSRVPGLGCAVWLVQCVLPVGFIAISVICIIKGMNNQRYRIPVITDWAEKTL
ncbi:MAG: DUF4870 domain-containing protein [Thermoanaerobaculia bacterium]